MKEKEYDSISEDLIGKKITLIGLAVDAKAGACVMLKNKNTVYVQEWEHWDSKFFGKKVSVTGTLVEKKFILDPIIDENGAISQGGYGSQLVLENAKCKLV
jgi:hypothetical protein